MPNDSDKSPPSQSLIERFEGDRGRAILLEVLSETRLLRGELELDGLIAGCELIDVPVDQVLIEQGGVDNHLYIVLSGGFAISVNGRPLTRRTVGMHLGEMAMIDSTARRSATARADEPSVVLKCSEQVFTAYANAHPRLWRRIAVELSRRLTERNVLIRTPRAEPVLFVACSREGIDIARDIQAAFAHDPFVVEIWTDGVFNPSKTPIEDLTALVERIDFGIFLLSPDDQVTSREVTEFGPRDNVVFELGLVMGAIGRERTFLVVPRGQDFKIPSDLLGVKPLDYALGAADTTKSRLGPVCTELRRIVNRLGPI